MPDEHACLHQIRDLDGVRLNRQRGIDPATGYDALDRQAGTRPHGEVFHRPHGSGTGRRREDTSPTEGGPCTLRHDGKFTFPAEIVSDIPLGKQLADQRSGLALWRDRIGDHHVDTGAPDGFLNDFAAGIKRWRTRRLPHHDAGVGEDLAFFILCSNDGCGFHGGPPSVTVTIMQRQRHAPGLGTE